MSEPQLDLRVSPSNIETAPFNGAHRLSQAQLATILGSITDGITVQDLNGQLIYGNDAAARLIGYPDAQTLLAVSVEDILSRFELLNEAGEFVTAEYLPGRLALTGQTNPAKVIRFRIRATGEERWSLVSAQAVFNQTGTLEFVVNIFHDITELKQTELHQRLLAQAGMALTAPLDFETRLSNVAQLAVPILADWCAVDILPAAGALRRLTVVHSNPAKVALGHELYRRYPPHPSDVTGVYAVLRNGQSEFYPDIPDALLEMLLTDPEELTIARQLQLCSVMIVPLLARDRTLGAITFATSESGRHYTPIDLALAEDLARRAALALDNSLLYAEAQRLNTELEQRVADRTAQLRDEIAERRQAEEQVQLLNTQLEERVMERTKQLERLNHDLHKEISERQQTGKRLRAVLQRTRELYHISRVIGSVRTPDEVLKALLSSSYLTSVSRASVAIFTGPFNEEQPPLCEILAAWNKDSALPDFVGQQLTLEEVGVLPPYRHDRPIVIENIQQQVGLSQHARQRFAMLKTHGLIIFPLVARGLWYGVWSLHYQLRRTIKVDDLLHMRGLVDQAAIAIDNIRSLAAEAQARQEAEQANELKLKFLAMISHELRTPLASIKGFATTLLADDVQWQAANQHDFLQTIDEETDKLGDLIEQLLDLSRIEAGSLRIVPKLQTLEHVIATALAQLQSITVNQRLQIDLSPQLPLIWVDAERLGQVLTNLVGNAARYSPAQTKITVTARCINDVLQVDVSDEGPGIPAQARARVFEPFQQLDRPASSRTGGAGLGLAICKGLIEAHGGSIWVQDHTGPGTTICFTLPSENERPPTERPLPSSGPSIKNQEE